MSRYFYVLFFFSFSLTILMQNTFAAEFSSSGESKHAELLEEGTEDLYQRTEIFLQELENAATDAYRVGSFGQYDLAGFGGELRVLCSAIEKLESPKALVDAVLRTYQDFEFGLFQREYLKLPYKLRRTGVDLSGRFRIEFFQNLIGHELLSETINLMLANSFAALQRLTLDELKSLSLSSNCYNEEAPIEESIPELFKEGADGRSIIYDFMKSASLANISIGKDTKLFLARLGLQEDSFPRLSYEARIQFNRCRNNQVDPLPCTRFRLYYFLETTGQDSKLAAERINQEIDRRLPMTGETVELSWDDDKPLRHKAVQYVDYAESVIERFKYKYSKLFSLPVDQIEQTIVDLKTRFAQEINEYIRRSIQSVESGNDYLRSLFMGKDEQKSVDNWVLVNLGRVCQDSTGVFIDYLNQNMGNKSGLVIGEDRKNFDGQAGGYCGYIALNMYHESMLTGLPVTPDDVVKRVGRRAEDFSTLNLNIRAKMIREFNRVAIKLPLFDKYNDKYKDKYKDKKQTLLNSLNNSIGTDTSILEGVYEKMYVTPSDSPFLRINRSDFKNIVRFVDWTGWRFFMVAYKYKHGENLDKNGSHIVYIAVHKP